MVTAAMPVAVARAASAPSSSIMRRSNIEIVRIGKARIEKAGIFALEPRLALLGAVVDETLGQEQRLRTSRRIASAARRNAPAGFRDDSAR